MTEAEWLVSGDPQEVIFHHLVPDKTRRLFAVACCRRVTKLLVDKRSLELLAAVEGLANGACTWAEVDLAWRAACDAVRDAKVRSGLHSDEGLRYTPELCAAEAAVSAANRDAAQAAEGACLWVAGILSVDEEGSPSWNKEIRELLDLLRKMVADKTP